VSKLKKIWSDPVWSKIISAAIIGLSVILYTPIQGLWPKIFEWFFSETKIPNGFLVILCSISILYIVKIVCGFVYRFLRKEPVQTFLPNTLPPRKTHKMKLPRYSFRDPRL
jgi:hypothetical protein